MSSLTRRNCLYVIPRYAADCVVVNNLSSLFMLELDLMSILNAQPLKIPYLTALWGIRAACRRARFSSSGVIYRPKFLLMSWHATSTMVAS